MQAGADGIHLYRLWPDLARLGQATHDSRHMLAGFRGLPRYGEALAGTPNRGWVLSTVGISGAADLGTAGSLTL